MKARTTTAAVLAALLASLQGVRGQEKEAKPPSYPHGVPQGMVLDGGQWRMPTASEVLGEITAVGHPRPGPLGLSAHLADDLAVAVLRQRFGPVPAAEIRALANALADSILIYDADRFRSARRAARAALRRAAWRPGVYVGGGRFANDLAGEPAQAAFDALVRVYETRAERALANGGDDPFMEAARGDSVAGRASGDTEMNLLRRSLTDVFYADPQGTKGREGRGWAYVLDVFDRSDPPPVCLHQQPVVLPDETRRYVTGTEPPPPCLRDLGSAWCAAGSLLHVTELSFEGPRPWPGPEPTGWWRLCLGDRPRR